MDASASPGHSSGPASPPRTHWLDVAAYGVAALAAIVALRQAAGPGILFLSSFGLTWLLVPSVGRLALRLGAVSLPGGRAINGRPTERLGGAAVFVPVLLSLIIWFALSGDTKALGLAGGASVMFVLGVLDDIRGVSARTKILGQVLAAVVLLASGLGVDHLTGAGRSVALGWAEIPIVIAWIVLCANAFNLIDGMDGLAASLAVLCSIALIAVGAMPMAALVVAGASLGFLRHNLPRARIFLGDCGSMVLGFLLAGIALEIPADSGNVPIALGIMAYPLGDVAIAVVRRFLRGKPLFAPDQSHLHHKILEHVGSTWAALVAILAFAGVLMAISVMRPGLLSVGALALGFGLLTMSLIRAGRVRWLGILQNRRPLRRLYVVKRYVEDRLELAADRAEVSEALRHMAEALKLVVVRIPGLGLLGHAEGPVGNCVRVPLKGGFAEWAAAVSEEGIIQQERAVVVTDLLRLAFARMCRLAPGPSEGDPTSRGSGDVAGTRRRRPPQEVLAK